MKHQDNAIPCKEFHLCQIDILEEGEGLRLELEGRAPVAVFSADGKFYVTDDTCSHGDASLSEGTVENGYVECPWHTGRFCLNTGSALTFPAVTPIKVYKTIVRDGQLYIDLEGDEA
jgi:nitrite reductase/ring-hydroxylating ferredoxin subunit